MGSRKKIRHLWPELHAKRSIALLKDLVERLNDSSPLRRLLATVTVKFVGPAAETSDVLDGLATDLPGDLRGIAYVLDGMDRVPKDDPVAPEKSSTVPPAKVTPPSRELKPCEEKAYWSYEHACEVLGGDMPDEDAYKWLREHGPAEYVLPRFPTWARHVRQGRRHHGTQRRKPRAGRTGRSVVRQSEIEMSFGAKRPENNRLAVLEDRFHRLHDLAGDLCLSEGAARRALWKKTVEELQKLGVEESCIKSIFRTDDPEELAEFAESLRQRGELLHREC